MSEKDIGTGRFINDFEFAWSQYNHKKYGVACNSGTNALFLALLALGIKKGDEVIVPEYTMAASAFAVTYTGATPVFVDCLDDLTVDPIQLKSKITKKTKAIMVVPIYGRPVSDAVYNIAKDYGLYVVEDYAEAHGVKPKGDITCYSFHGSKILQTGGGGMCLTDDKDWADEMRKLCHLYLDKDMSMHHKKVGYNFRLSNLQAAIGLAQVERIEELLEKRRQVEAWYNLYLQEDYIMPLREVVWVYDIDCGDKQEQVKQILTNNGIESRYGFKPMSMQDPYLDDYEHLEAYKWSKRILYIPCYPDLEHDQIYDICKVLKF